MTLREYKGDVTHDKLMKCYKVLEDPSTKRSAESSAVIEIFLQHFLLGLGVTFLHKKEAFNHRSYLYHRKRTSVGRRSNRPTYFFLNNSFSVSSDDRFFCFVSFGVDFMTEENSPPENVVVIRWNHSLKFLKNKLPTTTPESFYDMFLCVFWN